MIKLDTNDVLPRTRCLGPSKELCATQVPVAHEFGHAIGNAAAFARGDEYESASPHAADINSIMHFGTQLRTRHFDQLLMELHEVMPDTTFTLGRLV